MTAAWVGDGPIVTLLTRQHADPDAAGAGELTPLGIALTGGKDAATVALIEAGADIKRPAGGGGDTPPTPGPPPPSQTSPPAAAPPRADGEAPQPRGLPAPTIP